MPKNEIEEKKNQEVEKYRMTVALLLSCFGLVLAALVVVMLLLAKFTASDITSIVGLFTTVLGTLVGAFFGLQIGASGKEKTEEQLNKARDEVATAERKVGLALGALEPDKWNELVKDYKQLFTGTD